MYLHDFYTPIYLCKKWDYTTIYLYKKWEAPKHIFRGGIVGIYRHPPKSRKLMKVGYKKES